MKNSEYWKKRFLYLEKASNDYSLQTYRQIEPAFTKAQRQIESEINVWVTRFAKNNKVSNAEARRLLNAKELEELKWDLDDYIKYGKTNAVDQKWVKQLENASARFHINRLEALKLRTQQQLEVAFGNELDVVDKMARHIYTDDYYRSIFELQKGNGIGWNIGQIDNKKLQKVIVKPWAVDGKNFSDRIWNRKGQMVNELHQELTRTMLQGKAPDEAINHMTNFVDRKVKSAKSAAGTLVQTEQAYFHSAAQKEAYKELDVEEYEIVATLDRRTSEICQDMDGKHFPMKDYEPGSTVPPFHPNCRSVTVPYFDDEWSKKGKRAARNDKGETYYVPENMTYSEWKKKSVVDVPEKVELKELNKLKTSGMKEDEFKVYFNIISNHQNNDIIKLYKSFADDISKVKYLSNGGVFKPYDKIIEFGYPRYEDMNKYGTLAHEYGHFFDTVIPNHSNLHFNEIQTIHDKTGLESYFKKKASSSDEFLTAIRLDKKHISSVLTKEVKADMIKHNASSGVQDAIDGLFPKSRIRWGHGERYYNRKYSNIKSLEKMIKGNHTKLLKQAYIDLGMDASNQSKVKNICRQYEAASDAWANIISAEVNGGDELEYVKKYLPNSYKALLDILKGVKYE